jgi:hypothetical protein
VTVATSFGQETCDGVNELYSQATHHKTSQLTIVCILIVQVTQCSTKAVALSCEVKTKVAGQVAAMLLHP